MKTYQVTYTLPPHEKGQIYECQAVSVQHAGERCRREHPEAHIVLVQDMTPQTNQKLIRAANFVDYYRTIVQDAFRAATQLDSTFDINVHIYADFTGGTGIKVEVSRSESQVYLPGGKTKRLQPIPTRIYYLREEQDEYFVFGRAGSKDQKIRVRIPSAYRVTDPQNPTLDECRLMTQDKPEYTAEDFARERELRAKFQYGPKSVIIKEYELLYFAYKHADELLANSVIWKDPRNDEEPASSLPDLYGTTPKMRDYHAEHGLWQNPIAGVIYFDPDQGEKLYATAERVMAEYDDGTAETQPTWQEFELGGDDDVDYNGSHVMAFIELLQFYVKKEKGE